jgi:hypothetical protein
MAIFLQRSFRARSLMLTLAFAALPGCAVTTGAGQSRVALDESFTARYTVCTGVQASRLRERAEASRVCRRSEGVRVVF